MITKNKFEESYVGICGGLRLRMFLKYDIEKVKLCI